MPVLSTVPTSITRPGRARRVRGFTLVEFVVVIVIIALLGATATTRYSAAMSNFGADALARRVAIDLAYAQSLARRTGATQTVVFDVTNNKYSLSGVADPDQPANTFGLVASAEPYRGQITATALAATAAGATVVTSVNFDAYGFPDAAGTITVRVGSVTRTVTLSAGSGKATVQ